MDFTIEMIAHRDGKPFLYVDYNELIDDDLVLLSQGDTQNDYFGNAVRLRAGLEVVGYCEDGDEEGRDDLVSEGVCVCNDTAYFPYVKWLLKMNSGGIRRVSDIVQGEP